MKNILAILFTFFALNSSLFAISDNLNESTKLPTPSKTEEIQEIPIETTKNLQDPKAPQLKNISFSYLAANGIVPSRLGYGYRKQKGKHGFDIAGFITPYKLIKSKMKYYSFNLRSSYLRYFSPHKKNNYFMGLGADSNGDFKRFYDVFVISPSIFWGKQFNGNTSSKFFQLQILWLNKSFVKSKEAKTGIKVNTKSNFFLHPLLN
ncbi:MAG: hypothetical protein K1060chlam3_00894, partial [Candidatus Anoxychlamydiales bacterium]|nr:hypothetical protein [Candidatus Anoxychlamydiales bacterium]